jgi:hypothetical protein
MSAMPIQKQVWATGDEGDLITIPAPDGGCGDPHRRIA